MENRRTHIRTSSISRGFEIVTIEVKAVIRFIALIGPARSWRGFIKGVHESTIRYCVSHGKWDAGYTHQTNKQEENQHGGYSQSISKMGMAQSQVLILGVHVDNESTM